MTPDPLRCYGVVERAELGKSLTHALYAEQELIRDTARDFARQRIAPHAARWERDGFDRRELLSEIGKLGLMGVCVPTEWDGAGADFVSYVLATEEIAEADSGICNMVNVHNSPVCAALCEYGTPEQKERYLRPLARGEIFGAFLLTEPEAGPMRARSRPELSLSGTITSSRGRSNSSRPDARPTSR